MTASFPLALWSTEDAPLILASASTIRRVLIETSGIPVEVQPADIDERAIEAALAGRPGRDIAASLAGAKAEQVSRLVPHRIVLGADQTLVVGGRALHKPSGRRQAAEHLEILSGRSHQLHSGLALAMNGHVIWTHVETATMQVRPLSAAFINGYLDAAGEAVLKSVGAYQIEGLGMHLFDRIEGDHSTILGLPLLPLLHQLRNMGLVIE